MTVRRTWGEILSRRCLTEKDSKNEVHFILLFPVYFEVVRPFDLHMPLTSRRFWRATIIPDYMHMYIAILTHISKFIFMHDLSS